MALRIRKSGDGVDLSATIQPRASRNAIAGVHGDSLKIRLTAPPVEGAANRMCVRFLAKTLGISPSRITIESGETSRHKTIRFAGMTEETLSTALSPYLQGTQ